MPLARLPSRHGQRNRPAAGGVERLRPRERLRPDAELQRLGDRPLGAPRDVRASRRRSRARPPQPRTAGWRARLPPAARPGVPAGPSRAPRRGRPAHPPEARTSAELVDILESGIDGHRLPVLRRLGRAGGGGPVRARGPRRRRSGSAPRASTTTRPPARSARSRHVSAGYGKVAALTELQAQLQVPPERVVYVGDGSSDVHVMLHVNRLDGYTIAVSENPLHRADRPPDDPVGRRAVACSSRSSRTSSAATRRASAPSSRGTASRSRSGARCAPTLLTIRRGDDARGLSARR